MALIQKSIFQGVCSPLPVVHYRGWKAENYFQTPWKMDFWIKAIS